MDGESGRNRSSKFVVWVRATATTMSGRPNHQLRRSSGGRWGVVVIDRWCQWWGRSARNKPSVGSRGDGRGEHREIGINNGNRRPIRRTDWNKAIDDVVNKACAIGLTYYYRMCVGRSSTSILFPMARTTARGGPWSWDGSRDNEQNACRADSEENPYTPWNQY